MSTIEMELALWYSDIFLVLWWYRLQGVVVMESEIYRTAIYLRLSKDDESSGESYSISNQRQMLTKFVSERADLQFSGEFVEM